MKIASWNVNSIRTRLETFEQWLTDTQPDVVLLQETKCVDAQFPLEVVESHGYNCALFGQKSYNGVAILAKAPLSDVRCGLAGFDDTQARYIEAEVAGITVASIYVPNGQSVGSDKYTYKLHFLEALYQQLAGKMGTLSTYVLGGDFNIAPRPSDVHDPSYFDRDRILCSREERAAYYRLVHLGYVDVLASLSPDCIPGPPPQYTWWGYRAGSFERNKGWRIDHFLVSPRAYTRVQEANIDTDVRSCHRPSDHAPVWIKLAPEHARGPTPQVISAPEAD